MRQESSRRFARLALPRRDDRRTTRPTTMIRALARRALACHLALHARHPLHSRCSVNGSVSATRAYGASSSLDSTLSPTTASGTGAGAASGSARRPRAAGGRSAPSSGGGAAFVSAHFEVQNSDLVSYLRRRSLSHTENETHYIVRLCPFCHAQKDATDHFKLYILKHRGVFHCHRCQAQGAHFIYCCETHAHKI